MKHKIHGLALTTRNCRLSDFEFTYQLTKRTLFPHLSGYIKPTKKANREIFLKTYKDNIIIMRNNRRIGYFKLHHEASYTEIDRIYLSPAYQGKGIGKYFMLHFEKLANKQGHKKIKLQCWVNNPSCKFYKKMGYKQTKKKGHKVHFEKRIK